MNSIQEIFKDKPYDEKTLYYLENAINEINELFGNLISRDELIELIKLNGHIEPE